MKRFILILTALLIGLSASAQTMPSKYREFRNMHYRDLKKKYAFDLYPSINYIKTTEGIHPTTGLTLALKF